MCGVCIVGFLSITIVTECQGVSTYSDTGSLGRPTFCALVPFVPINDVHSTPRLSRTGDCSKHLQLPMGTIACGGGGEGRGRRWICGRMIGSGRRGEEMRKGEMAGLLETMVVGNKKRYLALFSSEIFAYMTPNQMLQNIDPKRYHVPEPINAICKYYCVRYT